MSNSDMTEVSEFCFEGRLIDFVIKDGYKLKGLVLATTEGEFYVKLAKHLRAAFDLRIPQGTLLQVMGEKEYNPKTGEVKLTSQRVMADRQEWNRQNSSDLPLSMSDNPGMPVSSSSTTKEKPALSTILVCLKSDCIKRGAHEVCQALNAALSDRNLDSQISIKATGCMKSCQAGPNLVMPDKTRLSRQSAKQVPALMEKHFVTNRPEA